MAVGEELSGAVRWPGPAGGKRAAVVVERLVARRRRRLLPAAVVMAAGVGNLLAGLAPDAGSELREIKTVGAVGVLATGRWAGAGAGFALLVVARWLARGSCTAWALAMAGAAVALAGHLLRGRVDAVDVLSVAALVVLASTRSAYRQVPRATLAGWLRRRFSARVSRWSPSAVRGFAEERGAASTAPLLALDDVVVLPLCQGRALAGVGLRNAVAVCLGAPVAAPELEVRALHEFVEHCERAGWVPALLAVDDRQRDLARRCGFTTSRIGLEAFLDVASFSLVGKRRANLRHSVARARRDGVVVLRYDSTARTAYRDAQLARISDAWLHRKGGLELGFTLGRFDLGRLEDQEVYIGVVGAGTPVERVVGFVTWLPYAAGAAAVLDLMRRAEACPPGTMEALLVDSLTDFQARGRTRASLGGVPLAATGPRQGRWEELLGWVYDHGDSVYQARGLYRFKDKFDPSWEPMFLAYPAAADLPRIAVATGRAFLPPGAVRDLLSRRSTSAPTDPPADPAPVPRPCRPVDTGRVAALARTGKRS